MRTAPLGCFEGLVEQLYPRGGAAAAAAAAARDRACPPSAGPAPKRVVPGKRIRHRAGDLVAGTTPSPGAGAAADTIDPSRFAGLEDRWFWRDEFTAPVRVPWYQGHAADVAAKRAQDPKGWSLARLAEHFHKSVPTIRKAL